MATCRPLRGRPVEPDGIGTDGRGAGGAFRPTAGRTRTSRREKGLGAQFGKVRVLLVGLDDYGLQAVLLMDFEMVVAGELKNELI